MLEVLAWREQLTEGLWMTIRLSLAAYALGLVLALCGAWAKLQGLRAFNACAQLYTTVFRSLPEILVVFLVFYGGGIGLRLGLRLFAADRYIELNSFAAGVLALGLVQGAYGTDVLRGAILAVPRGHAEAALLVGMSRIQAFRRIVFPQLWRYALPGLGNLWLGLLKDTAIVSVIGVEDLVRRAKLAIAATRLPFTFYGVTAIVYLCLTALSMVVLHHLEQYARRGVQS
jgi:His/Glu/Gln/Arg/opine family amino acid ABC transporter permease subunit